MCSRLMSTYVSFGIRVMVLINRLYQMAHCTGRHNPVAPDTARLKKCPIGPGQQHKVWLGQLIPPDQKLQFPI